MFWRWNIPNFAIIIFICKPEHLLNIFFTNLKNQFCKHLYLNDTPHLLGEVCHHVMEALLINEMLVNFVLFGSDILWEWFSATEDLEQLLLITLL